MVRSTCRVSTSSRKGSGLRWYTAYTGSIWCSPNCPVHFGINRLGLINVYAYDIAKYPLWQQKVWAGHNVPPDGAVCDELLAAQMRARPAHTKSPEELLELAIGEMDQLFVEKFRAPLFRTHHAAEEIVKGIHRFRAVDKPGLLSLAKDLARLIADRIDVNVLRKIAVPPAGEKWGSLKSLEKALASKIEPERAATMVAPLFGIYELRLGDAHLPSTEIDDAMSKARVDQTEPFVEQGAQLIYSAAYSLHLVWEELSKQARAPFLPSLQLLRLAQIRVDAHLPNPRRSCDRPASTSASRCHVTTCFTTTATRRLVAIANFGAVEEPLG